MKTIEGGVKSVRNLMSGMSYSIDYYQREYSWQKKQVTDLIEDLTECFLECYDPKDERKKVQSYKHYFLGSVIINIKNNFSYIIDGQQRLSTLTLLFIYLYNRQKKLKDETAILENLIYSSKFGEKSFNIDVEEREKCLSAIFSDTDYNTRNSSNSVKNLYERYNDIFDSFPSDIDEKILPYFTDWLIENVLFVEIKTFSEDDAYSIFETMNDRGLRLDNLDMLKGYLLTNIKEEKNRNDAAKIWKSNSILFSEEQVDYSEAIKSWLRSQYTETIRERSKGARPGDYDLIGTEFHRWVKANEEKLHLEQSQDFYNFLTKNMHFYANLFLKLKNYSMYFEREFEFVYYIDSFGFTLHFPLLLASISLNDNERIINQKIRIVSSFVEILLVRRIWNFRSITYNTLQYYIFTLILAIRNKSPNKLVTILTKKLEEQEKFSDNRFFGLRNQYKHYLRIILARITDYIEQNDPSHFEEYMYGRNDPYEIEHIWSDHFDWFSGEIDQMNDFDEIRNRIGGLLLLPKSFNSSFSDLPPNKKIKHYCKQNLLAASLCKDSYEKNPKFKKFIRKTGLDFKPYNNFKLDQLDERQELCNKIAEIIWSPERLCEELER